MRRMITQKQIETLDKLKYTPGEYEGESKLEITIPVSDESENTVTIDAEGGISSNAQDGLAFGRDTSGDKIIYRIKPTDEPGLYPQIYFDIDSNVSIYAGEGAELKAVAQFGKAEINLNGMVNINDGGLTIGTYTEHFKLCDKDSNTPICNANWTHLSPNFPSQFDDDGRPLFQYKINHGGWGQQYAVSSDFLISKDGFNTLAPTKLGFYDNDAEDYFTPYNISSIAIMSTYGNTLTYTWDNNQYCFVIDSFTPLTGTQIGRIDFNIGDRHKPVYFDL